MFSQHVMTQALHYFTLDRWPRPDEFKRCILIFLSFLSLFMTCITRQGSWLQQNDNVHALTHFYRNEQTAFNEDKKNRMYVSSFVHIFMCCHAAGSYTLYCVRERERAFMGFSFLHSNGFCDKNCKFRSRTLLSHSVSRCYN